MSKSAWILLFAFVFWFHETSYFGWNFTPQSSAELICDGIVWVMVCIGIAARRT